MRLKGLKPVAVFLFLAAIVLANPGYSPAQTIECEASIQAWSMDKSLSAYMATHRCTCPRQDARPVCIETMSAAPSKSSPKNSKIDFQKQIAATVVSSLLDSLFSLDPSPNTNDQAHQEQLRQQAELERQELDRKKQEAVMRWNALQQEEALSKDREARQKQKAGQDLLTKMGSSKGGLTSFKWEKAQESEVQYKPVEAAEYSTSKFSQWQRLLCATYFSSNALKATKGGNDEQARFLNEQADKVMAGQSTALECKFPAVPEPPTPKRTQNLVKALSAVQTHVQSLQEIETRLTDVKQRVKEAGNQKESAQIRLQDAQTYAAAAKPEEKADADRLLAEALAALQESEKELADAKQSQDALSREKDKTESELKDIQKRLAANEDK